jgi:hypothetical protein
VIRPPWVLGRAIEICEVDRLDFAEAYLVAFAETTGVGRGASFDRIIGRVNTVERVEPMWGAAATWRRAR